MIKAKDEYIEKQSKKIPNVTEFIVAVKNKLPFAFEAYRVWLHSVSLKMECDDIVKKYNNSFRTYFANKVSDSIYIIEYTDYDDVKRYIPYVVGKEEVSSLASCCTVYPDYDDALLAAICIKYMKKDNVLSGGIAVDVIGKMIDKK